METISLESTRSLRNLYFVRIAFQVVWAAGVITTALKQPLLSAILFLLYLGIGLTVFETPIYAVAIFGLFAFGAGVLQLVVGLMQVHR